MKKKTKRKKVNPYIQLLKKIDRIKNRIPKIDPTGVVEDPETKEVLFRYTEAQKVFEIYREQCDIEGLRYGPYIDGEIQPKVVAIGSMPLVMGTYCIEDIKTGAKVIGWGTGMGANRDWSGNTASTRALKQFLLTVFEATWRDPDDEISAIKAEAAEIFENITTPEAATNALTHFFSNFNTKENKNGNPRNSGNTKTGGNNPKTSRKRGGNNPR